MIKIGFLHSLIRPEEKLLIEEINKRENMELVMIDDRELIFDFEKAPKDVDLILERSINHSRALYSIRLFEMNGVRCVNTSETATICGDKLLTSIALKKNKINHPELRVAFTEKSTINAIEEMGYPVVLKPAVGSWGRLISKINDRDSAEAILEHKTLLGTYHHSIFYAQKFVPHGGRDIRSFVIGGKCIAAIYRTSNHWKTNTALGGRAENCELNKELCEISEASARAVLGDIVAVDLFETENGYLVNEVNYTMEFRNSIKTTGVNIPKLIIDYMEKEGEKLTQLKTKVRVQ